MQLKRAGSIIALVCALIAGLIATSSAYIGWILIDETRLGWVASRGIAFMALIVGVLSLILLTGGLETPKEPTT
jgi:uncharacterized membrane protein